MLMLMWAALQGATSASAEASRPPTYKVIQTRRENRSLSVFSPPAPVTHTSAVKTGKRISRARKPKFGSLNKDTAFSLIYSFF